MDRRDFLKYTAAAGSSLLVPSIGHCGNKKVVYSGWIPNPKVADQFIRQSRSPFFAQQAPKIIGSGKGRIVLLYKYLEKALGGEIIPHTQYDPETKRGVGDCVGQAYGMAVDILGATQIYGTGKNERWVAKASTEAIYAGSRYEIGVNEHGARKLLLADGTNGIYTCEFLQSYGVLVRKKYGDIDLTEYSVDRAKDWGKNGVPDELESIAKQHPVRSYALVRNYEDVRDSIANGYPVVFCSSLGFEECKQCNPGGLRDAEGFLKQCGTWFHAFAGIGMDDTDRPGVLAINSWGSHWSGGPKRHKQPDGSFWIEAQDVDALCESNDSFAISNFVGFPAQELNYNLF